MISLMALWLPIVLSAVAVFIVSSIIHMVLPYHRSDFRAVPSEEEVMDALCKFEIPPGEYILPRAGTPKEMGSPEFVEKLEKGPVAFMTGLTMLLVEQNVQMALAVSDYAYVLANGKVELEGPSREVAKNEQVRESYLGI